MSDDADPVDRDAIEYDVRWGGRPTDGQDPLQTFAMTVLAAHKQAGLAGGTAIVSRVLITETDESGRPIVITAHLRMHGPDAETLQSADDVVRRQARERADRDGTTLRIGGGMAQH